MSSPPERREEARPRRRLATAVYAVFAVIVVGLASFFSIQSASGGSEISSRLTLIAPAGPGGGWDTFQREMQQAMRVNKLVNNVQVVNVPGAAGTIGLGKLTTMHGRANNLMVTGTGLVAGVAQLVITDLATKAGIAPGQITYIPKSGGGEAAQALVTDTAQAATSGYMDVSDQIEGGRLRALGIAAPTRLAGVDIPTLTEQGVPVTLANWRAVVAPPGITAAEKAELVDLVTKAVQTPQWHDAVERNRWTPVFLTGPELDTWLSAEVERITKLVEVLK